MNTLIPLVMVALWLVVACFSGWLIWTLVTAIVAWLGRH